MKIRNLSFICFIFGVVNCGPANYEQDGITLVSQGITLQEVNQLLSRPFVTTPHLVSPACRSDGQLYLDALQHMAPWALNMYDAAAKIQSGILTGNTRLLGNFDQCLKIRAQVGSQKEIRGQYCSPQLLFTSKNSNTTDITEPVLNINFMWALCVPASCTVDSVATSLRQWTNPPDLPENVEVIVTLSEKDCSKVEERIVLRTEEIVMICVLAVLISIILSSTILDIALGKRMQMRYKFYISFSLYTNCKRLFSTDGSKEFISCLSGLRFLSMSWIILDHTFYVMSVNPLLNSDAAPSYRYDWTKMVILNGTLPTDTFFLISGILLCYLFLKEMTKTRSFNLGKFYLHRYLRITPTYAMLIFFYSTLLVYLGSGPLWKHWVGTNSENCRGFWWTNLLYVNNYLALDTPCLDHTWYLAVDMQLFWFSPIIVYPLWRWPKLGRVLLMAGIIGTILATFLITFINRLTAAMLYFTGGSEMAEVFTLIYTRAYTRAGPYIIGVALGYLLFFTRDKTIRINKLLVLLGWAVSASTCLASLYGVYVMYQATHEYDVFEASFYASLHRPAWALGVAWVVFACFTGYGGPVNRILSWRGFLPLGRLTFAAYLSHYMVLIYNVGTMKTPNYMSNYELARQFLSNLVIVLAVSTVLTLSVEIPFLNLERIIMNRIGRRKPNRDHQEQIKCDLTLTPITEMKVNAKEVQSVKGVSVIKISENDTYGTKSMDPPTTVYKIYDNIGYS